MAHVLEYYHEYYDIGGALNKIELLQDGYSGGFTRIEEAAERPVRMRHTGSKIDFEKTIIQGQELIFSFHAARADVDTFDTLFESDYKDYKVRYYIGGVLEFEGYVKPENLSKQFSKDPPYVQITLSATDALADLKNVDFGNGVVINDTMTILEILKEALTPTGILFDFRVQLGTYESNYMASTDCALEEMQVDARRFFEWKTGKREFLSCWQVIEAVLKDFNVKFKQLKGKYQITCHHEGNSREFLYDWTTLTASSASPYSKTNILDLANYKYDPIIEQQKVRPLKAAGIVFKNKDLGGNVTGMDLDDWANDPPWKIDFSNGSAVAAGVVTLNSDDNTYDDFIETAVFNVTVPATGEKFLKITFDHILFAHTSPNPLKSPKIKITITRPDVTTEDTFVVINPVWESYESPIFKTLKVIATGNYSVRLSFEQAAGPTQWTTASFKLKTFRISTVISSSEGEILADVVFDEYYKQTSDQGIEVFETDTILADGGQVTEVGALLFEDSAWHITSTWRTYGHTEDIALLDIYARYILDNRYSYKNYLRIKIFDRSNNIDFDKILTILSKNYVFISYDRDFRAGFITAELVQLLTTQESYGEISRSDLNSIDGERASSSVNVSYVQASDLPPHNQLEGKQGGQSAQYYHLTSALHTLVAGITTWRNDVSQTEMGCLDGVTSDVQTQITARAIIEANPADDRIAIWTGATGLEGDPNLTWSGSLLHVLGTGSKEPIAVFEAANDVSIRLLGGVSANPEEIYIEFTDRDDASNSFAIGLDDDASKLQFGYGTLGTMNAHTQMTLQSDGKFGIGTIAIPHGGVGYAKFAIEGTDGNAAGPHVQFTTPSDNYPLVQILNWFHDDLSINFDAYYDGAWKSSDIGSNFQIYKQGDKLSFRYDSGIAQGSTITWNSGITLNTSGQVGINDSTPLYTFDVNGIGRFVGNLYGDADVRHRSFASGWQGTNWRIEADGDAEFRNVMITGGLQVWELILNRLHYQCGGLIIGAGGGKVSEVIDGTQGAEVVAFEDPEGNDILPFTIGAIVMLQDFDLNRTTVIKKIVREVDAINSDFSIDLTETVGWVAANDDTGVIAVGDEIVAVGHVSNAALDASLYFSAVDSDNPFCRVFDGVDSWAKFSLGDKSTIKMQWGNLESIAGHDIVPATPGFGLYSDNVYLSGKIVATSGSIGGWIIDSTAIYSNDKHAGDDWADESDPGITLMDDGSIHCPNFYVNTGGEIGLRQVEHVLFKQDGESQGIKITGRSIWENELDTDLGTVYINGLGYDGGNTRFRNTQIGDGKEGIMALFHGSNAQITLYDYTKITKSGIDKLLNVEANIAGFAAYFFNNGNNRDRLGIGIQCGVDAPDGDDNYPVRFYDSDGTYVADIHWDNAAIDFAFSSDIRLKENIQNYDLNGLDIISQMQYRKFNWRKDKDKLEVHGWIADEVEKIYPEMVSVDPETGYKMNSPGRLIPVIMCGMKELIVEKDELKERIKMLDERIKILESLN